MGVPKNIEFDLENRSTGEVANFQNCSIGRKHPCQVVNLRPYHLVSRCMVNNLLAGSSHMLLSEKSFKSSITWFLDTLIRQAFIEWYCKKCTFQGNLTHMLAKYYSLVSLNELSLVQSHPKKWLCIQILATITSQGHGSISDSKSRRSSRHWEILPTLMLMN